MAEQSDTTKENTLGQIAVSGCGSFCLCFLSMMGLAEVFQPDGMEQLAWMIAFICLVPVVALVGLGLYYAFRNTERSSEES
jgi:hypothetical protein